MLNLRGNLLEHMLRSIWNAEEQVQEFLQKAQELRYL